MKKLFRLLPAVVLLLCLAPACTASSYAPVELTGDEAAAANLFLSNFTEIGLAECSSLSDDMTLVDFAHDHLWFNDHDSFEYGEYDDGYNCRVSDDRIQEIINKYIYDSRDVELSLTRFNYKNGYYYHCETGGWTSAGFAHATSVCPLGENQYFISFLIFGSGSAWSNGVMDDTLTEIETAYGAPVGCGSAVVYASDLSDRTTYKLVSYARLPA